MSKSKSKSKSTTKIIAAGAATAKTRKVKPAKPAKPADAPGHYTVKGTRKFQCNGPRSWEAIFLEAAMSLCQPGEMPQMGAGIRHALTLGVAELTRQAKLPGVK